ncbi:MULTISPECIES: sensor histidine kinase [Oceanospirillaceae]|jgi:two-component system NtrC family sensor kinase|uniref:sensor histidine kinase n=1 Tax=Oceanospirillaceae TaxID=135620 RepID=UPI001195ECF7|nr:MULTISPECIES: ATP-binding protein [Thalassolituus]MCA6058531.1 two-component sensor histidine kinase [Thalassolituus sp. ST750PaO-4]MCB2385068.1 two-component sensor histidine kinase [Thalassolituus alkanivorans]MCB2423349.1 two-component sensor histidine kinase [Thalassolituus alkanivorans]TVV42032.1 two-component sensor histidine kinase [Thalassolituus sp. C2-1]
MVAMSEMDYEKAYLREKQLRKQAEQLLEDRSRELFLTNEQLKEVNRNLQEQQQIVVQSEKMASLGVLAAGVAHEINNPLGYIYSNFSSLVEGLQDIQRFLHHMDGIIAKGDTAESLRDGWRNALLQYDIAYLLSDYQSLALETIEGLERVKQIVADLKSFIRQDDGEKAPVDVNDCLRGALNILNNQTKYHAQVDVDYGELPVIQGYFGKLNQVFTNLIANANQAVPENGLIRISSRLVDGWIEVAVSDNGHGISEENMRYLFTPFFTTKPVGEGTGLGLSISHGMVQEHGGEILVKSKPGEGSTFTVRLPVKTD